MIEMVHLQRTLESDSSVISLDSIYLFTDSVDSFVIFYYKFYINS